MINLSVMLLLKQKRNTINFFFDKYIIFTYFINSFKTNHTLETLKLNKHDIIINSTKINQFPGLPQLGYTEVEPIILDELHITLGGGPNGYKAQFKDIEARGVSSVRVTALRARLSDDEVQLQLALSIPKIQAVAKYRSSGTLILVQASGAGDYWGEYGWYILYLIFVVPFITDSNV